jgi:hypothetical protein
MRLLLASVLILGLAAPAGAQTETERRSHATQCLLAMSAANGSATNDTARGAAKIGMLFFAAELFGMDPNIDLTASARAELPSLTRDKVQTLIPQCGSEMHRVEGQIAEIGKGLKQGGGQGPQEPKQDSKRKQDQGR